MALLRLTGKKEKDKYASIIKTIAVLHDFVLEDKKQGTEILKGQSESDMIDWLYRDIFSYLLESKIKEVVASEKIDPLDYFLYKEIIEEYKKTKMDARSFIRHVAQSKIKNYSLLENIFLKVKLELDIARRYYLNEELQEDFSNNKVKSFVIHLKQPNVSQHQISTYITNCFAYDGIDIEYDSINSEEFNKQKEEKIELFKDTLIRLNGKNTKIYNDRKIQNEINALDLYSKYYVAKTLNKKQEFKSYLMNIVAEEQFNNFGRNQQENKCYGFNYDEILKIMNVMTSFYAQIKANYEFEAASIMFSLPYLFETIFEDKITKEKFKFGSREKKDHFMFYNYYKKKDEQLKLIAPYIIAYYEATEGFIKKHSNEVFDFEELDYIEIQVEEIFF